METPLRITFRHMDTSPALDTLIREKVAKLETIFNKIIGCHVVVETPHHHQQQGRHFKIEVHITVPGDEIIVGRDPTKDSTHEDVHVALRDAFDAAKRQLQTYLQRRHGDVKKHTLPS